MSVNVTGPKIAETIDNLCKNREITTKELERNLGLSNGYIRKLRLGQTPSVSKIHLLADYFGVDSDFIMYGVSSFNREKSSGVLIPLVGRVAGGLPIEASENIVGYEEIPRTLAESAEYFALLIKGESMAPYICNGDKVIVRKQEEVENGQIAIVLVNGSDATCKEFRKTSAGVMLISKNPNYDPMVYTKEEVSALPVRVIGRVVEIRREV